MVRRSASEWYRSGRQGNQTKYEGRRGLIARATRTCLERKGIAKTSIADITREVDITRELFYYYFPNKDAVVQAVIEGYAEDACTLLSKALESADDEAMSLLVCVMHACRAWLSLDGDRQVPMLSVLHEANIKTAMMYRVAGEALEAMRGSATFDTDANVHDPSQVGRVAAIAGAMSAMLCDEAITDEQLAEGILPLFS